MPFADFLKTAVLLFAASATALAVVALASGSARDEPALLYFAGGWWLVAALIGSVAGRRLKPTAGTARLMAGARSTTTMPEIDPGSVIFARLWGLGALTLVASGVAFLFPQVPAVGAGYSLLLALAWRRQAAAVEAVEGRDGMRFYVEPGSPLKPASLVRTPWLRREEALEQAA